MSNYPSKEKNTKAILIAIIFVLTMVCAVSLTIIFTRNTDSDPTTKTKIIREDPPSEKSDTSEINEEPQKPDTVHTEDEPPKTTSPEVTPPSKTYDTVEEYISQYVRPMCNDIYTKRNTLTNEKIATDTTAYYRNDGTLALVITTDPMASNPWEYRYHFDEKGEPVFIFIRNGSTEHRYYYREGAFVRYISPDKITTDYPTDIALCSEGQDLFDHAKRYR